MGRSFPSRDHHGMTKGRKVMLDECQTNVGHILDKCWTNLRRASHGIVTVGSRWDRVGVTQLIEVLCQIPVN